MRYAEIEKGIEVCEDEELKKKVGISKVCAKNAVIETSLSRSVMAIQSVFMPTTLIMLMGALGIAPQTFALKTGLEICCVTATLRCVLPMSVSIYSPTSQKETASDLEEEFKKY